MPSNIEPPHDHIPSKPGARHGIASFWVKILLAVCVLQSLLLGKLLWHLQTPADIAVPNPAAPAVTRLTGISKTSLNGDERFFKGHPGPWGELEYFRINIVSPDDRLPVDPTRFPPTVWTFNGMTPDQLSAFFQSCDLTAAQRTELLNRSAWSFTNNLILLKPSEKLILEMPPTGRSRIYGVLANSPDNDFQTWPFTYELNGFDEWFENTHASPATFKLLKSLMYQRGESLCFSDLPEALRHIPLPAERYAVAKTLMSRSGLLMKLRIRPDSDIAALTEYWSRGRRAKDVGALLDSLALVPGSASIDIVHILPVFARTRVNSFPRQPVDNSPQADCYWTAMNFFKSVPDPYYENETVWRKKLTENYTTVSTPTLGDVIFLTRPDGVPYHAAVYIADDVVFTKNGGDFRQPWLLMKMADMLGHYPTSFPPQVVFFRQKESAD